MKRVYIYIVCAIVLSIININVKAACDLEDNLCNIYNDETGVLIDICSVNDKSCEHITTENIFENHKYNLFEIKDKEVYLNNVQIRLSIYEVWNKLDYKIHITGDNTILHLQNFNHVKYDNAEMANNYPHLYENDYIPFSIEGDGTLEIKNVYQIIKNADGEVYYTWNLIKTYYDKEQQQCVKESLGKVLLDCTWGSSNYCNKRFLTESEIKEGIINDIVHIGIENSKFLDPVITNMAYYFPGLDIDNQNERVALSNNLFEKLTPTCNYWHIEPESIQDLEIAQPTRDWAEKYIQTNMNRSFTEDGSYLLSPKAEEGNLEEITTTQSGNIVFTSSEPFDSNYHLGISDITEELSEADASKVVAKTDKTLIKLYDIYMLDKDNKIVNMGNGTYTIKEVLSDLLKKYNDYQVVYINDSGVELIPAKVEDGYIVFNTTHLSKYGIVGLERTTKRIIDTSNNEVKNPKTADNVLTYGLVLFTLMVASITTIIRIRKIEKVN